MQEARYATNLLTHRTLRRALKGHTAFHRSARQAPLPVVMAVLERDTFARVAREYACAHRDRWS